MRQPIVRHLGFALAALAVVLLIPTFIFAQDLPPVPHSLEGRADCLTCHQTGVGGATQVPDAHPAGWTNDICQACHKSVAIPIIPHSLQGRGNCLACHATGVAGFPQVSGDHAGRTNDTCQGCHQLATQVAPAAELPAIPAIPHPLEGRDNCLMCHATGIAGVTQLPGDHAVQTDDVCQVCHQPAAEAAPAGESLAFPAMPHSSEGRKNCLACHRAGLDAFPQLPGDHAGQTDDACQACHQVSIEVVHDESPKYPIIPHPLETRNDCRACHATGAGGPRFPNDHADWPGETCRGCHQPEAPVSDSAGCLDCHTMPDGAMAREGEPRAEGVSTIPHPLVAHDDCRGCHQGGVGGAPLIPRAHTAWTNAICRDCHQPTTAAPAEPIPTPIVLNPRPENINSCRECHLTLQGKHGDVVPQWERSIHAERQVSCPDCHGGDPAAGTMEAAKSPEANYIGVPARADIPALCASCHADVARMRQYDLPTDQWARYRESIHGYQLSKGDANPATCFDCHGGHQILKVDDPASTVYPSNVADTCAGCHASEAWMAAYNLPTNQFDLYRQSVHGQTLFDNRDFRAPTCATCHSSHGPTPPGFEEVADICASCHATTQEYYLKSPHAKAGRGALECVTCHGPHGVSKPSEDLFVGSRPGHCGACHNPDTEPGQVAQSLYAEITAAAQVYEETKAAIQSAQRVGTVAVPLQERLREAEADLTTIRAAQHALNPDIVHEQANDIRAVADEVKAGARKAIIKSIFLCGVIMVAVIVGGLTVALFIHKRELDRQLGTD